MMALIFPSPSLSRQTENTPESDVLLMGIIIFLFLALMVFMYKIIKDEEKSKGI